MADDPTEIGMLAIDEPTRRRRSPAATVAVLLGILAVLGGVVFAAFALSGDDEGSPESAVEDLFDAASHEDVIGVLEALPPSERETFQGSVEDLTGELKRLQVLGGDFDLHGVDGVDLEIRDAHYATKDLRDDLAAVTVTGGTVKSSLDPKAVPLGDFVRDTAGDALRDATVESDSDDLVEPGDELVLATVKEDGRWYVSVWYSVAENARKGSGTALPPKSAAVPATGAPTPERAVEDLLRAGADLNLRRVIELLPPDEARVVHEYAPLFLPDAERAIADAGDVNFDITKLAVSAKRDGGRALVKVDDVALTGTVPDMGYDEETGESIPGTISWTDGCLRIDAGPDQQRSLCGTDALAGAPGFGLFGFGAAGAGGSEASPKLDVPKADLGFVTVERDGRWFVSPTRTVLDDLVALARALDRPTLDRIRDAFQEQIDSLGDPGAMQDRLCGGPPPAGMTAQDQQQLCAGGLSGDGSEGPVGFVRVPLDEPATTVPVRPPGG